MRRRVSSLLLVLAATGCIPHPMQVYSPDASAGQIVYSSCALNSQVPVGVRVAAADVDATVSLARHSGRSYVEMRLDVPEGKTVVLQDAIVKVATADPQASSQAEFPVVSLVDTPIVNNDSAEPAVRQFRLSTTAPLVGRRIQAGKTSFNRHFWLATYVETTSAREVWLTLPSFTVNGTPASLPRLHFLRQAVLAMAVFNC